MLRNYFYTALRTILHNKTGTLINVFCLALGISCCMVAFQMVRHELSFDAVHTHSENVYRVVIHDKESWGTNYSGNTPYPFPSALRNEFTTGDENDIRHILQTHGPNRGIISVKTEGEAVKKFMESEILFVEPSYLELFDFGNPQNFWIEGYNPSALAEPNQALLAASFAEKLFGSESALGKTIYYNKDTPLQVAGVVKDSPRNTSLPYAMLVSYATFKEINPWIENNWGMIWAGSTFLKLNSFANISKIEEQLNTFPAKVLPPKDAAEISLHLQPITEVHTDPRYGEAHYYVVQNEILWGLPILGLLCLLVACVNFINLSTAQATKRAKEVGIRKTLGGKRSQLVGQLLGETALVTLVSLAFALWFGELMMGEINNMLTTIKYNLMVDGYALVFAFMMLFVVTLIAGFYPALVISKFKPIEAFQHKLNGKKGKHSVSLRKVLVVSQFIFSQALVVMVLIVASQMSHFKNTEWGFDKEHIVNVKLPRIKWENKVEFREQLMQLPKIDKVSLALAPPITSTEDWNSTFYIQGKSSDDEIENNLKHIDENYLNLFQIPLMAGRNLSKQVATDSTYELIVNETLANKAGYQHPEELVGETLIFNGSLRGEVVGVVKDFHNRTLQKKIKPSIYFYRKENFYTACVKVRSEDTKATIAQIEQLFNHSFPEDYFDYTFVDDEIEIMYIVENLIFRGLSFFALITILIGCLGLYGLVAYTTNQKSKEIGIRKVMGASVSAILWMFSAEFGKLILIAFVVAAPVTWFLAESWLQNFYYRIPLHYGYFVGGVTLSALIAIGTVGYKSFRAATVNPVKSLRDE